MLALFHILPYRAFGCSAAWNLGPNKIVNAPRGGQHFSIATCKGVCLVSQ
jgi:hypothetical protein